MTLFQSRRSLYLASVLLLLTTPVLADTQKNDESYTAKIREFTTDKMFSTDLVDHLPASDQVPTPEKVLGYISGAKGKLTHVADVNRYMREVAKATSRVKVFSIGKSEEGREMIVVAVSDEGNLRNLDRNKLAAGRLADPRNLTEPVAEKLLRDTKPMYYATGAMHSPETGSPEMLMELVYRLAVEETPMIQDIRKNVIFLCTPVLETDGRDRVLDYQAANKKTPGMPLVYWGKYVAHDNNRDGMGMALALTRNIMSAFMEYHPIVLHDLHESVPLMYTSTGSGPYNAWLDPITINEWHQFAYHEINELTRRGLPGVWTHGFYDGWAPNYMFYIANGHNAIGRFYETFGNSNPDTQERSIGAQTSREWFRPNPPLPRVNWSLRNNVNYQQSGLLTALSYTAKHRRELLENYLAKSRRSIAKAVTEGPAAWILPVIGPPTATQRELVHLLQMQGVEVSRLSGTTKLKDGSFPAGSFVVRMDQPYCRMADMLLDTQYYSVNDPSPYDDTGWTLGALFGVRSTRVLDIDILKAPMERVDGPIYGIAKSAKTKSPETPVWRPTFPTDVAGRKTRFALVHTWQSTQNEGWWRLGFERWNVPFDYVSLHTIRDTADLRSKWDVIVLPPSTSSGSAFINGVSGSIPIPWKATAEFPHLGGPDSTDDIRGGIGEAGKANLRRFVESGGVFVSATGTSQVAVDLGLVSGLRIGGASGLDARGSVLQTVVTDSSHPILTGMPAAFPVYFGGSPVFRLEGEPTPAPVASESSARGGGRRATTSGRTSGRGGSRERDVFQGRPAPPAEPNTDPLNYISSAYDPSAVLLPEWVKDFKVKHDTRVLLRFAREDHLLVSGMLEGGSALEGRAALTDTALGRGHILLFAFNPMWRAETVGTYGLVFGAGRLAAQ